MDAILIQSPNSKLEATGSIPFSITRGVLTDQPMTIDITSAGIDLAVLEAANTGLVNAAGLLVVDVHVTGTGSNPVASGSVRVQQGAFTVAATGAVYSNASIDATLEGQAVQVTRLQVVDDNGDALQGTGRVQLENQAVRDIEFVVTGNDFTVLDNELGHVSVDASLNLYGTVRALKVAGLVRLHSARLEVDQIVDRFASSPYEPVARPDDAAKPAQPGEVSLPLGMNLVDPGAGQPDPARARHPHQHQRRGARRRQPHRGRRLHAGARRHGPAGPDRHHRDRARHLRFPGAALPGAA